MLPALHILVLVKCYFAMGNLVKYIKSPKNALGLLHVLISYFQPFQNLEKNNGGQI